MPRPYGKVCKGHRIPYGAMVGVSPELRLAYYSNGYKNDDAFPELPCPPQDVVDYLSTLSSTDPVRVIFDGGHYEIDDTVVIDLTMPVSFDGMSNSGVTFCAGSGLDNKNMFELYSDVDFFGINFDGMYHNSDWKEGTNASFIKLFGDAATECTYFTSSGGVS